MFLHNIIVEECMSELEKYGDTMRSPRPEDIANMRQSLKDESYYMLDLYGDLSQTD